MLGKVNQENLKGYDRYENFLIVSIPANMWGIRHFVARVSTNLNFSLWKELRSNRISQLRTKINMIISLQNMPHSSMVIIDLVMYISSLQSHSSVWLFVTPWIAAHQASLSITNSWSLPKPMFIKSVVPSSHFILRCPLLLLPPVLPSIRVFSNESTLHIRWPKYWSFSFNINPSSEHVGLISFRMDLLDLLAVQGTLKSLLQHHSSKASIQYRALNLDWQLVSYMISYMFQCHSPKSSHPLPLSQSP